MKDFEKALDLALINIIKSDECDVLIWLLSLCETDAMIFNKDHSIMAYLSGKQSIGKTLIARIKQVDDKLYLKLQEKIVEYNRQLKEAENDREKQSGK